MKRVRRERTVEEDLLYSAMRHHDLVLKRNDKRLPGKPDLLVANCRLAIFVDGDYWHGRAWFERGAAPRSNRSFWIARFESNRRRDRRVDRQLRKLGWCISRVWGSDIRRDPEQVAARLARRITRLRQVRSAPSEH
jgi:DNA mismatch endonuclease Vsr